MDIIATFGVIAGIVFLGYFAELIFKRANIPDVIFLIGAGILMGTVFNIASPADFGEGAKLFTTFALIFILFQGALNMDFKTLFKSLPKTMALTVLTFIFTVIIVTAVSFLIYQDILM